MCLIKMIYKQFLEFVQRQNRKLPCWWIFGHEWPVKWQLRQGWLTRIDWRKHMARSCKKCAKVQCKKWDGTNKELEGGEND